MKQFLVLIVCAFALSGCVTVHAENDRIHVDGVGVSPMAAARIAGAVTTDESEQDNAELARLAIEGRGQDEVRVRTNPDGSARVDVGRQFPPAYYGQGYGQSGYGAPAQRAGYLSPDALALLAESRRLQRAGDTEMHDLRARVAQLEEENRLTKQEVLAILALHAPVK